MQEKKAILEPDSTYHIYNRANGNELLFKDEENYQFFLEKYRQYVHSIAETFCYCLMPNHFHFLLRVKGEDKIANQLEAFPKFETLEKLLSKRFSNLFSSYTQAFNKQQGRKGSLFMKNFNRVRVSNDQYFKKLIHYIHHNPVQAELCDRPVDWKYSSYRALTGSAGTMLLRNEVLEYFGDRDNFIHSHKHPPLLTGVET